VISPSKTNQDAGASQLFPPLDRALIQAMACEIVAETEEPLSRQSVADLVRRAQATLSKKISRSTVWRMLHESAIKPWQHEHWLFPKDPRFAEKAGPVLDLHAGMWEGEPLRRTDYVLSMDEKILVHTPIHASWLNQVEIYFSIIQRKVLTPNDFAKLSAIRVRLALYEELSNRTPKPFAWKFTRQDTLDWLKRASPHFLAASAVQ
jgi:hypothetical protein